MQVLGERLSPGMQDQGGGDLPAQPARIGAKFDEGCRDTLEEQPVKERGVALGERVQLVRQGKHQMERGQRQELSAPRGEPAFLRQRLALRAMSFQQVQRRGCSRQVLLRQMEIARGGAQAAMTEQALDRVHVDPAFEQMRGEGVAQPVDAAALGDAGASLAA